LRGLAILVLLCGCAWAQGWKPYANARYGYRIDIPGNFRPHPAPANNDGRTFTSSDGASLDVYGSNNVTHQTLPGAFSEVLAEKGAAVTYKAGGTTWFAVSWRSGGKIFYQKQFIGSGSLNAFIMAYPTSRRQKYDAVLRHIERSFNPGDLARAH
jgi:hypothetical protein